MLRHLRAFRPLLSALTSSITPPTHRSLLANSKRSFCAAHASRSTPSIEDIHSSQHSKGTCPGCGVLFQTTMPNRPGFIDDKYLSQFASGHRKRSVQPRGVFVDEAPAGEEVFQVKSRRFRDITEQALCSRCFGLQHKRSDPLTDDPNHQNQPHSTSGHGSSPREDSFDVNELTFEPQELVRQIPKHAMVVYLIDGTDLHGSFSPALFECLRNRGLKFVVALNKMDSLTLMLERSSTANSPKIKRIKNEADIIAKETAGASCSHAAPGLAARAVEISAQWRSVVRFARQTIKHLHDPLLSVVPVSSTTTRGFDQLEESLRPLLASQNNARQKTNSRPVEPMLFVVGTANAGKSTFVKSLLKFVHYAHPVSLTSAPVPGVTAGFLKFKVSPQKDDKPKNSTSALTVVDTPGVSFNRGTIWPLLQNVWEIAKPLKRFNFKLRPGLSLVVGGVVAVDITAITPRSKAFDPCLRRRDMPDSGSVSVQHNISNDDFKNHLEEDPSHEGDNTSHDNTHDCVHLSACFPEGVSLHVCRSIKSKDVLLDKRFAKPNLKSEIRKTMITTEVEILASPSRAYDDLVFPGFGWIVPFAAGYVNLSVTAPKDLDVLRRPAMITHPPIMRRSSLRRK